MDTTLVVVVCISPLGEVIIFWGRFSVFMCWSTETGNKRMTSLHLSIFIDGFTQRSTLLMSSDLGTLGPDTARKSEMPIFDNTTTYCMEVK